jgi:polysaccharide biosynthesis transport protein
MHPEEEVAELRSVKGYEAAEYLGLERGGSADVGKQRGVNLKFLRRLMGRNAALIGIPTFVAAILTAGVIGLSPQSYSGSFQLLVEPMSNDGKLSPSVVDSPDSTRPVAELDYVTLVRVLTSPNVLSGIVQRIHARYPKIVYANFIKNLEVERIEKNPAEKTKILSVTYEGADSQQVLFVLNELAKGYITFGLEDRKSQIGGGVVFIEQQLPELKQRVATLESQLQSLQQKHKISDLETEGTELSKQARQIQTQQLEAQRDLAAQRNLSRNLQSQLGGLGPQEVVKASALSENPRYQGLLDQLKQVEKQISLDSATFQPEFPEIQKLQEQRKNLINLISQETQKLVGSAAVPQFQTSIQKTLSQQLIDSLNQLQILETRTQALSQASNAIDQKMRQFPEVKRRSGDLQAQLEIAQNTLKQLQLKRGSLRLESAQKEVPWQLIAKPDLLKDSLGRPIVSSRKALQKMLMGTLGGFLLGMGCAILREKRQDMFHSLEDLQEEVHGALVGIFPKVESSPTRRLLKVNVNNEQLLNALQDPQNALSRAAEGLYTNLRFLPLEAGVRSLVIASNSSHDGKTTVVTHLAKAAATMGQRVLVVDSNMVVPQIHTWLDVPNYEGLNEVLTKGTDPNQLIQRSPQQTNVFVLPSGQVSQTSRKLLASQQMQHLMNQLHSMFDLVLYDTPPLQSYADANFLGLHSDGLLMVVSVGKTRRSQVLTLFKKLQSARIPLLGVVANQVKLTHADSVRESDRSLDPMEDEFEIFRVSSSQNS